MSDVAVSKPITDAYLDALAATGRPIGDAQKPPNQEKLYPYGILYCGTARMEGTLVDPHEDGLHRIQLTSVGMTRKGVEDLRDLARPILLDKTTTIDGHTVVWAELVTSQPVTREDDGAKTLFSAVDVVNVLVTPVPAGS